MNQTERNWAMLCHLSAFSLYLGVPFGNILGPLIIWLVKKDEYPFVNEQGKEALNFQISLFIYGIISGILCFILIGYLLLFVLAVADIVLIIIAAIKTSNGENYRYPSFTIRLI